ncbi:MAG: hypothetical protein JW757_07180 [Anaerolineales bacterium]|nr:hypothetical protein [Anaerolineales bacterium]
MKRFGELILIIVLFLSACSADQPTPDRTLPPTEPPVPTSTQVPTPAFTPIPATDTPTPAIIDDSGLFEQGHYNRDEYCSRVFDYHKMNHGALTIAIADNLEEPQDLQKLADKVLDRYTDLAAESPVPISQPFTIFIVSNPSVGECYSRDQFVFAAPEDLDARSFVEDMIGAGTGIGEYWVKYGLTSLALGEQPDQEMLKTWYQDTDDLDMTGLFVARFLEDWATEEEREVARMSATSLVRYALMVENIAPDQLVEQVNNDVRTRWLASLGVERNVTYPHDGRFTGFFYSQNSQCSLIVQTDKIHFCLNRLPDQEYFDDIAEAEFLIDHAYYGRIAMEDFLDTEAPSVSHLMDTEELIQINVWDTVLLGKVSDNTVTLSWSGVYYWILHEIVHTINWRSELQQPWLIEGFAQYLGAYLPIYPQTENRCIFEDFSGRLFNDGVAYTSEDISIPAGTSYCYFLDAEQSKVANAWYLAQGGSMETEDSINARLYADAVSYATIYRNAGPGSRGASIGYKYDRKHFSINADMAGMELSYTQAASFIGYLCDTYSIDRVLNVYVNDAENGLLDGKTYEELKAEWQADLISRGEGIAIPGQP